MRVCHKCGYIEPAYWKHCRFSYWIDSISFENFKILHPNLAIKLKKGGDETEDKYYVYRRCLKKPFVHRKAKVDFFEGLTWSDGTEKYVMPSYKDSPWFNDNITQRPKLWKWRPEQTKLLEKRKLNKIT